MEFVDAIAVKSTRERTDEGFLKGKAHLTTVGVQQYLGRELTGKVHIDDADLDKIFNVFRPPTTVFHPETIKSAELKPITFTHPDDFVGPDNYRDLAVGHLGDSVAPADNEHLWASVLLTDEAAINALLNDNFEVSLGYACNIVKQSGIYKGQRYDFAFDGPMLINHLAIEKKGRCGSTVKILDKESGKMTKEEVQAMISDALKAKDKQLSAEEIKTLVTDSVAVAVTGLVKDAAFKKILKDEMSEEEKKKAEDEEMTEEEKKKAEEEKKAAEAQKDKAIKDAAAKRVKLLEICRPLLSEEDKGKVADMADHELLVKAAGTMVKDADSRSDDFLIGFIEAAAKDRRDVYTQFGDKGFSDAGAIDRPLTGIGIQNLKGGK